MAESLSRATVIDYTSLMSVPLWKPAQNRTVQEILQSLTLPEGFTYEAIGFTEDGWILSAPSGDDLEIGTVNDDTEERAGYAWQEYDGSIEDGNLVNAGGGPTEEEFRVVLSTFIGRHAA